MENWAIEIHDSTLDDISVLAGEAVLHYPSVYMHESLGTPGVDAGRGWVQEVLLRIGDATITKSFSEFPAVLLDGHIMLGHAVLDNVIPIPLNFVGAVELRFESWNDEAVVIIGSSAVLEMIGQPKYVEEFRP